MCKKEQNTLSKQKSNLRTYIDLQKTKNIKPSNLRTDETTRSKKEQKSPSHKKRKLRTYVELQNIKSPQTLNLRTEESTLHNFNAYREQLVRTDIKTEGKVYSNMGLHQNKQKPAHRKAKPTNDPNY